MPAPADRPLLFLDVDGTLLPFGPALRLRGDHPGPPPEGTNPLLARLTPEHGRRLSQLPCDLVWASSWMADANAMIGPALGLPHLPVVEWPDEDEDEDEDEDDGRLHWKTRGLVNWAAGRPFVWVDDEITTTDRTWVRAHHPGQVLLHRVDPRHGLTNADFTLIERWLADRHEARRS